MATVTIISFAIFQVFYGLLSHYHSVTVRASPEDVATVDAKLWLESTPLAAFATIFLLGTRILGILFLLYLGYKTTWYYPIVLFVGSLIPMVVVNAGLRAAFGTAVPALLGFVVLPVVGSWMWFTV